MKELGRFFRTYCYEKHTNWPAYIRHIEDCLNNVPHASTGRSPSEIVTGNPPRYYLQPVIDQHLPHRAQDIAQVRQSVQNFLTKAAIKRVAKQRVGTKQYQVGDLVLLRTNPVSDAAAGLAQKFALLYEGPLKISSLPHPNVYELVDPQTGKIKGTYNTANLRPYLANA